MFERVDVDLVLKGGDSRRYAARANLQEIRAPGKHRILVHPDEGHVKLVRYSGRRAGTGQQVAAADVDLMRESECD